MKKILFSIFIAIFILSGYFWAKRLPENNFSFTKPDTSKKYLDLSKYSIEAIRNTDIPSGKVAIQDLISKEKFYSSFLFTFSFQPEIDTYLYKRISGQLNIPSFENNSVKDKFPIILMIRGYVDQKSYKTGDGTRNAAGFFAKEGFITIAPDFLGYGTSDSEAGNIFETRFQTYVTVISLLKSLNQIPEWDGKNVFIWAHSNGGQIALTALSVLDTNYPTTLWAPVTKAFPYSVLYYTDESDDGGKLIRKQLSIFEEHHDTNLFSFTNYLVNLDSPINLSQGTNDEAVPKTWSDDFVRNLKKQNMGEVEYFICYGCDHNMRPNWNDVVANDLLFFKKHMVQ